MENSSSSNLFNTEFLITLSNWQNGWGGNQNRRREIADRLVEQCKYLPDEFKNVDCDCYRKRFIVQGEIISILLEDSRFEGISSWTTNWDSAKIIHGFIQPNTKFAMIFKHKPTENEVIVNIPSLWKEKTFIENAEKFKIDFPENAKALFNFRDHQSEIVLRSTLRGSEIENIAWVSSSFDELCNKANIPENIRDELYKKYISNPEGIEISLPIFTKVDSTKRIINNILSKTRTSIINAKTNNIPIYGYASNSIHPDDLKHQII